MRGISNSISNITLDGIQLNDDDFSHKREKIDDIEWKGILEKSIPLHCEFDSNIDFVPERRWQAISICSFPRPLKSKKRRIINKWIKKYNMFTGKGFLSGFDIDKEESLANFEFSFDKKGNIK